MTPDQARAMYRRAIGQFETIQIRRYTGSGTARPRFDWDVQARVMGFQPDELIGSIVEGDSKLIVLHEDLVNAGFPFPIQSGPNWKVVVKGKELQIKPIDDKTRRLGGEIIAYVIAAGG